jgi:excinuclease UvrABC helicase subunit UvrB
MSEILNDLFDDFNSIFGKGSPDERMRKALEGKEINRKEFRKGNQIVVEEKYNDEHITYFSRKVMIKDDPKIQYAEITDVKKLQIELEKATSIEDYEAAAKIRDRINEITTLH